MFAHLSVGSSFHLLAIVNIAAMNMSVPIFVPVPAFNLLCMYADVKLVDHTLILYLSF